MIAWGAYFAALPKTGNIRSWLDILCNSLYRMGWNGKGGEIKKRYV